MKDLQMSESQDSDGIDSNSDVGTTIPTTHLNKMTINSPNSNTKMKKLIMLLNKPEYQKNKKQIDTIWTKYDADCTGSLEKKEAYDFLRELFLEIFGTESKDCDIENIFTRIDTNNDDKIEQEEMHLTIRSIMETGSRTMETENPYSTS